MSAPEPTVRKPGPPPNDETRPFWEGLRADEVRIQRCEACGLLQHHPRALCHVCWSERLTWVTARGTGRVWTWTVVHRPSHAAWSEEAPYAVLVVELDEGPRLVAAYEGDLDALTVDLPVRLGGRPQGDGAVLVARPVTP